MGSSKSSDGTSAPLLSLKGNAGSYAVTTTSSMPWLTNSTSTSGTPTKTKIRKSKSPQIMNPIFEICAQLIPHDPFWVDILRQASYNKMPRGFLYRDGYLTFKKGTRIQRISIPGNPAEALSIILDFFKNMGGIRSSYDREQEREESEKKNNDSKSLEESSWSDIKKKKIVESLIEEFIRRNSELMNLSVKREKEFRSMVNSGFLMGNFCSGSVVFDNGRIRSLAGLEIDLANRTFKLNSSQFVTNKSSRTKIRYVTESEYLNPEYLPIYARKRNPSLSASWVKYLELFDKRASVPSTPRINFVNGIPETPGYYGYSTPSMTPRMTPSTHKSNSVKLNIVYSPYGSNNGKSNPVINKEYFDDSSDETDENYETDETDY